MKFLLDNGKTIDSLDESGFLLLTIEEQDRYKKEKSIVELSEQRKEAFASLLYTEENMKSLESTIRKAQRRSSAVRWIHEGVAVEWDIKKAQSIADEYTDKIQDIYFEYLEKFEELRNA